MWCIHEPHWVLLWFAIRVLLQSFERNCDSAALLPPHIETQPTHTETSEAWNWRDAIKLDPSNCILWGYMALQSKGFLPRWKYWKEGMDTWKKTWTVSRNHHASHQQHPPAWSATTCGSNLNHRCKTGLAILLCTCSFITIVTPKNRQTQVIDHYFSLLWTSTQ